MPYLTTYYGNPHSRTHMYGWESEAAVEHARKVCKKHILCKLYEKKTCLFNENLFTPTASS